MKDAIKPVLKAGRTNSQIANQGYTYNEAGFTYNQTGWQYGGKYENDIAPLISKARLITPTNISLTIKPSATSARSNKQIENQGYTYNEAGFTYNQIGWMYGGVFEHDIYPLINNAKLVKPRILLGMDFGATVIPPTPPGGNAGRLIGMLGMTYAR